MAEIKSAIEDGLRAGMAGAVPDIVKIVMDAFMKSPAYPVIVGGQIRLMKAGMEPRKAWETSRRCVAEFLADEKVTIGHPGYVWTPDGGAEIVEEYELAHWESMS